MIWSAKQDEALQLVHNWTLRKDRPFFYLAGYAGSGKSTLANHFASGLDGTVLYAAFTGKAAYVMQQKGCKDATTIHSLIYKPKEKNKTRLLELKKELEDVENDLKAREVPQQDWYLDSQWKRVSVDLKTEREQHRKMMFALNPDSQVKNCSLLVIDECSMVDQRIGEDLLSFGRPILVLGDPAQLPPVFGTGYFTSRKPEVLLTEIHRQARGNPILELAHTVRSGGSLTKGVYGDSKVISTKDVNREEVMASDQVLVGLNKTRFNSNKRMREILGRQSALPEREDKLVCLRNNRELGLLNGGLWNVNDCAKIDDKSVDLSLTADVGDRQVVASAHDAYFLGGEPPFWDIKEHECFDYGYALTVHKAQGSQWDALYLFNESRYFRQDARKWLYTGITRAAKRIVVVND